jgi:hypothetical protein
MTKANHFWVTTVPRTGSMWTYNAVRAIAREAGRELRPEKVPQLDETSVRIYKEAVAAGNNPDTIYAYKVHELLNKDLEHSKFLTTIRDPREIAVSFMRFMKVDFENGFSVAKLLKGFVEAYSSYNTENVMFVNYNDIVQKPTHVLQSISGYMDVNLTSDKLALIADQLSPHEVRKNIEIVDKRLNEQIAQTGEIHASEVVVIDADNFRLFDVNTGFQTGHVSGMASDAYRGSLTPDQVRMINDFYGDWLENYGFPQNF